MRPEYRRVDAAASHCASDDTAASSHEQLARLPAAGVASFASTGERAETPDFDDS
jgi:hypothetical protein